MFNQNNNEEKKLDWMYKGPNSTVDREEYLLGRSVDKTLEQLNDEDKQKQQGLLAQPKNRVEHECIPPSIRDFNKLVQAEQVDLSTKLQEDPLVAIKKREEETRWQFLQNPVQLKKLQKALKAQEAKKNKKKKKKKKKTKHDSDSDLETKLTEKLLGKTHKKSKEERDLDTILIHKFEALKDKLTEEDLQDIFNGKLTDSDDTSEEDENLKNKPQKKHSESAENSEYEADHKKLRKGDKRRQQSSEKEDTRTRRFPNHERSKRAFDSGSSSRRKEYTRDSERHRNRSPHYKNTARDSSGSSESKEVKRTYHSRKYDSDDSDNERKKKVNYGLVSSDGKKISLSRKYTSDKREAQTKTTKAPEAPPPSQRHLVKKLTEEEKERMRQEMMDNAVRRDKERAHSVRKYREKEEKEKKEQNFDPDFVHKQLLKSADTSSVESRIKANLNNIQRSSGAMDRHFSRR